MSRKLIGVLVLFGVGLIAAGAIDLNVSRTTTNAHISESGLWAIGAFGWLLMVLGAGTCVAAIIGIVRRHKHPPDDI